MGVLQPLNLMGEQLQMRMGSESPRPGNMVLGESVTTRGLTAQGAWTTRTPQALLT